MQKRTLISLLSLLLSGPLAAQTLTASLDNAQVVAPTTSSASAWAVVHLQPGGQVAVTVDVDDLTTAVSCELRHGAPGVSGALIMTLAGGQKTWTGSALLSPADRLALATEQTHLVISSVPFPNGEIRGQIVAPRAERYASFLEPDNLTPAVVSSVQGTYRAHLFEPDNRLVVTFAGTTGVFATHFELHHGVAGSNGPLLHTWLRQSSQGYSYGESRKLTVTELQWLRAGELYVEAWGNPYPYTVNVPIARDQLLPVARPWSGDLSGNDTVPPSASVSQNMAGGFAGSRRDVWTFWATRSAGETACKLRHGLPGTNGPVLYTCSSWGGQYWRLASQLVTPSELAWLENGECYLETEISGVPHTRAQIVPNVDETPSFGGGCPDSNDTQWHLMEVQGIPAAGAVAQGSMIVQLVGHGPRPAFGIGLMAVGFNNMQNGGQVLPIRLDLIGASPDCYLLVEASLLLTGGNGFTQFTQLNFPADPLLRGSELFAQGAMFDPAVVGAVATTNALMMVLN